MFYDLVCIDNIGLLAFVTKLSLFKNAQIVPDARLFIMQLWLLKEILGNGIHTFFFYKKPVYKKRVLTLFNT